MKWLTRVIDLVLYTSLFTACCAVGLCMATERLINGSGPAIVGHLHLFIFGSAMLVYNTPRIVARPYGKERKKNKNRKWYLFFFGLGLLIAACEAIYLPASALAASALLSIFAFAYFLPVLPFREKKRLRDFGWTKIIVLAGVWTTSTSVLPILYWGKPIMNYPMELLLRLLFIFSLCVVFDIRDMQADERNNIHTLPHKVGVRNSYRLINTSLLLFVFVSVFQNLRYPNAIRLSGALFTAAITWTVVGYLKKHPSERAYSGLADGVMIVYSLLVLIPS